MSTAIRVENLGKKYVLRHRAAGRSYVALRDVLTNKARSFFQKRDKSRADHEEFWALQDVSFEIKPGEAVGIIGRNGAGKSTLLKILSRIVKPTRGRIEIEGRVASLLEVGTGFHPELTGRENIYLNGAIMGMPRVEIRRKFDEIIAFAEVEKFLDTPVKHYSSGMYVRLAFAVAAHLEPEILIVDEVLAVGDLQFQKKCLTKMEDVTGKEGRTVLFVSHNMDLITKLCSKALLLNAGKASSLQPVDDVTREYLNLANSLSTEFRADNPTRAIRSVILDRTALTNEKVAIRIHFKFARKIAQPVFGLVIYTEGGTPITGSNTLYHQVETGDPNVQEGSALVIYEIFPLWSGRYNVSIWLSDGHVEIDHQADALTFEYVSPSTPLNAPDPKIIGSLYLRPRWSIA